MVNTGKPSRGCYMCRARRIKCDEGKPGCMRCQKSKRICPGYRDAFELKLRDESKSTKKKHNRKLSLTQQPLLHDTINQTQIYQDSFLDPALFYTPAASSGHFSHSRNNSTSSISSQESFESQKEDDAITVVSSYTHHLTVRGHMTTPINQQAACYYLANFVLVPKPGTLRGYFDFVMPLLKERDPSQSLLLAFSAVSLAAMGSRPNSKALLPKADLWYLNALKEINSALRDPRRASTDATLVSVMLMASFEQLTPTRLKIGGWGSHVDGAVAVIKSRGTEQRQWQSNISRNIFISVRAHMTIYCIANSKAADPTVDWLAIEAEDPIIQSFAVVNLKMAQLRADTDKTTTLSHSVENTEKVMDLLRRAHALDLEYVNWIKALPAGWEIKTVAWVDSAVQDLSTSLVHPGRVDAYGELWMAYRYNIVRSCRLFIYTTILRCAAWLGTEAQDYRLTPEYTTASRICRQLIEDIVSSVPYFFGWNSENDPVMKVQASFACGTNDGSAIKPLSGVFAMWPLFAAAASDFASPSQRIFLRGRLKHVAELMGVNQALILFESNLSHPSMYIMRERANLRPSSCEEDDLVTSTEEVPPTTITLSPALSVTQSSWIPRTFGFGENGFFQNAVAMKQNMQQYLESYELTGY